MSLTRAAARARERGQAVVESLFTAVLLTFLLVGILQIFTVHNYVFQMANNAYYSLFKDVAYTRNRPNQPFDGYGRSAANYRGKPLRAVSPWPRYPGRVQFLSGAYVNWTQDDRASVPMLPFYEEPIIERMKALGVQTAPVRLKVGTKSDAHPGYLDMKFLYVGSGTRGNYLAAVLDIAMGMARGLARLGGAGGGGMGDTGGIGAGDLENGTGQLVSIGDGGDTLPDDKGNTRSKDETFKKYCTTHPFDSRCKPGAQKRTGDEAGTWRDAF